MPFFDALELCLPRLAEVHLHDAPIPASQEAIVYGKDHSVLGTGDLDLPRFLDRLEAAAFDGLVVGTSNRSEILLGYGPLFGDTACSLNPLRDTFRFKSDTLL